jgi:hypothetical protein
MSLEPSHPPYIPGAITIPRQIDRWLDVNPQNGPLDRTHSYIVLPAFAVSAGWEGFPDLVLALDFVAPNNFSLTIIQEGGFPSIPATTPPSANAPIVVTVINGNGLEGVGGPEGVVTANPGTTYFDTTTDSLWYKKTGNGNTGWRQVTA